MTEPRPGLFRRFANRLTRSGNDTQAGRISVISRTQAGVSVDAESALKNAAVWACIRYLTGAVAQLPWRVVREERDGDKKLQSTHPVDWLLNKRPNVEMGAFTFRQTLLGNALRYGNGYAEIEWDKAGRPINLWPLHPTRVTPKRFRQDGRLYYEVQGDGAGDRVDMSASDIFHIRGFGDGPVGYNVVEYAAQSIGWAQATELFGASFFGEGMNPGGIVEGPLKGDALKRLKAEFRNLYQGPRKASRTVFLDAGMKWTQVSTKPDEAQFVETRQHQVEEICRWFGVPPHKVMHLLRATFSNIEHQAIEVVTDSVVPWARIFEDEADYKLFGQNRQGLSTQMDLAALLRGDLKAQAEHIKILREVGVYSVNDAMVVLGRNKIGPAGDKRMVPLNFTTLDRLGEGPAAPADMPPAPAEDPQSGAGEAPASANA